MATAQDGDAAARELPIRSNPNAEAFDIVATYHRLLAEDPDLTMPMAAIEALIEFLGHTPVKTVYETIDLVKTQSARLEAAVPNPLALSHGTHLFSQYLMNSLKQPAATAGGGGGGGGSARTVENPLESFEVVRQHLLRNGRLFAERAKRARERIAVNARRYLRDGQTVLTMGGSRVVGTLLARAAEKHDYGDYVDQPRNFKVIYAIDPALETESNKVVATLREKGVRVATVPFTSIAYVMAKVDKVIVGAEAVTANGGIISSMGTYQAAIVAKQWKKNFYVVAEQHKFGRTFPADQFDFTFDQAVIGFQSSSTAPDRMPKEPMPNPVDYTPPQYIDQFFADHRVMTPFEVASEVIDTLM